jgi:NADPH-dependent 2,4-dienoyl-CoA reductase/sulfur reductase-like enzyme
MATPLQLYKAFLVADKAREIVLNFYKLRVALGLSAVAVGSAKERYQVLKDRITPLCLGFFLGKSIYTQLEERTKCLHLGTTGLAVCVVGSGPVGLRTAIELAMLGQEVTVIEKQLVEHVDRRANVLKLWKWVCVFSHLLPPRISSLLAF